MISASASEPAEIQILSDARVPPTAVRLYALLKSAPQLWPKDAALKLRKTPRLIQANIQLLSELGYIEVIDRRVFGRVDRRYDFPATVPIEAQRAS